MPKPISWSEFSTYKESPEKYYEKYILGIREPGTRPMILGSIIHSGFEGKDWRQQMKDENFTPDFFRAVEEIMKFNLPKMSEQEAWLGKKETEYEETECALAAKVDGVDYKNHIILELKTGGALWNEQRANEHGQITLYAYIYWKTYGVIPECMLVSFCTKNGKNVTHFIFKTKEQLLAVANEVKEVVRELKKRGWWENRISSSEQICI